MQRLHAHLLFAPESAYLPGCSGQTSYVYPYSRLKVRRRWSRRLCRLWGEVAVCFPETASIHTLSLSVCASLR